MGVGSSPPAAPATETQDASSSQHLFYFGVFLDVDLLPAVLLQLHRPDGIQGDAAGQVRPLADNFGADGTVDDLQHRLPVADVNGGAAETGARDGARRTNTAWKSS